MTKSAEARRRQRQRMKAKKQQQQKQVRVQAPTMSKKQRSRKMRGGLGTSMMGLAASSSIVNTSGPAPQRASGTDYIDLVPVDSGVDDGAIVADFILSPYQHLEGTHFAGMAGIHEFYKIDSLEIDVVTRVPATVGGGYIVGITPDVKEQLSSGLDAKRYLRALPGSVSNPWWQSARVAFNGNASSEDWYHVNEDEAEAYKTQQARVMIVVDGPPQPIKGSISVSLQVRWTARFKTPVVKTEGTGLRIHSGAVFETSAGKGDGHAFYWASTEAGLWKRLKWGHVYVVSPEIKYQYMKDEGGTPTTKTVNIAAFQIGETRSKSLMVGFFNSIENAKAAGDWHALAEQSRPGVTPYPGYNVTVDEDTAVHDIGHANAIRRRREFEVHAVNPGMRELSQASLKEVQKIAGSAANLDERGRDQDIVTELGHAIKVMVVDPTPKFRRNPTTRGGWERYLQWLSQSDPLYSQNGRVQIQVDGQTRPVHVEKHRQAVSWGEFDAWLRPPDFETWDDIVDWEEGHGFEWGLIPPDGERPLDYDAESVVDDFEKVSTSGLL